MNCHLTKIKEEEEQNNSPPVPAQTAPRNGYSAIANGQVKLNENDHQDIEVKSEAKSNDIHKQYIRGENWDHEEIKKLFLLYN